MANNKVHMVGGRRYKPAYGNIDVDKTTFLHEWSNGRPFKHGAMRLQFIYTPASAISAIADAEIYLSALGLERGQDYHIPPWNFNNQGYLHNRDTLDITFNSHEMFIMSKLSWSATAHEENDK